MLQYGQEYLALSLQSFMKYRQFLIPPQKNRQGLGTSALAITFAATVKDYRQ